MSLPLASAPVTERLTTRVQTADGKSLAVNLVRYEWDIARSQYFRDTAVFVEFRELALNALTTGPPREMPHRQNRPTYADRLPVGHRMSPDREVREKVEDDPARIVWMRDDGTVLREIDGHGYEPMLTEPQGIARDPRTGHLLIVDDWEGTNSLFELDAEGRLLGTHPLIAWGRDPEGIAIRPGTNMLFMAFDGGARIAAFDYVPTVQGGAPPDPGADCAIS